MQPRKQKNSGRDNIYWGAFLGMVFPAIGFVLYWIIFFSESMSLPEYWESLFTNRKMSGALALALILNLPVFLFYIRAEQFETTKGIVGATIFFGVLVILFKFA